MGGEERGWEMNMTVGGLPRLTWKIALENRGKFSPSSNGSPFLLYSLFSNAIL